MNRVRGVFLVILALQEREVLKEEWVFLDLRETGVLRANLWVIHPDKNTPKRAINTVILHCELPNRLYPAYKNPEFILEQNINNNLWFRVTSENPAFQGCWECLDRRWVLSPIDRYPFKQLFMVKNRNVIVRVCVCPRETNRDEIVLFWKRKLVLSTRLKSVIIHAQTEVYFCQGAGFSLKATAVAH